MGDASFYRVYMEVINRASSSWDEILRLDSLDRAKLVTIRNGIGGRGKLTQPFNKKQNLKIPSGKLT